MLIVFDLDGTLIDSSKDLALSMNAMLEHFGRPPLDPEVIYSYVGNGAPVLVHRALGPDGSEELLQQALQFFLKFYRAHSLEHTELYPGVRAMIENLAAAGHRQAILTNKPVRISFDIVGALGLQKYFMRVYGGDSFLAKKPDPIGIVALRNEAGASADQTLMVGDSGVDVQTARNAGIRSCGVAWGFQPRAFDTDPPDLLIREPRELLAHLPATDT